MKTTLLIILTALASVQGAEPPRRTSLSNKDLRYTVPAKPYVVVGIRYQLVMRALYRALETNEFNPFESQADLLREIRGSVGASWVEGR